jgi:prepilin-type N-terminal cleavage/methylation domain-containing protein
MYNKKGVTLVELLAVIVILAVIASIATVLIGNLIDKTRLGADQSTLENLNYAISLYDIDHPNATISDIELTNDEVFSLIVNEHYLSGLPILQSKNSLFIWDADLKLFKIQIDGTALPLSPYGDTFEEIVPQIIADIQEHFDTTGSYGRTWGDYQYTDIGLDPDDWDGYILHIHYKPSGSNLRLDVEEGYQFVFDTISGSTVVIRSSFNWSIIYSDLDQKWYYHSIDPDNEVDISTLIVELS